MARYAEKPDDWSRVAEVCRKAGICGFDTEFWYPSGEDVRTASVPHRGIVHVFSLAVFGGPVSPSGHRVASGVVLPAAALGHRDVAGLLADAGTTKVAHNAPVDVHAVRNTAGIEVAGVVDSLQRSRVQWPGLERHGLKSLCSLVGRELREYEDVLARPRVVNIVTKVRVCACPLGDRCEARGKGHSKHTEPREAAVIRGTEPTPLTDIVPGHPLAEAFWDYSAGDAIVALELWDLMTVLQESTGEYPGWTPEWNYDQTFA